MNALRGGAASGGIGRAILALVVVFVMGAAVGPSPAAAQFGVDPEDWIAQVFGSDAEVFDQATDTYGEAGIYDQAGGHPWKGITDFTMRTDGSGDPQGGNAENVRVDVPVGLVPNPTIFPRCPRALFDAGSCLPDTQIGIEELTIKEGAVVARVQVPLYNVEIAPDQVALFGFHPADAAPLLPAIASLAGVHQVEIVGGVRDEPSSFGPHDTGLYFTIDDAPESPAVLRSKLTFWGVPGDPVHDPQRDNACATVLAPVPAAPLCSNPAGAPSTVPELPFLTNPTKCGGLPLQTRLSLWSHGGEFATVLGQTPTIDGKDGAQHCDLIPFGPEIDVTPDTAAPDAPVGPAVTLSVPQDGLHDAGVLTSSHVKDVTVELPPGMTINPSAANGLAACTDAQLAANTGIVGGDECPDASKVGDVDVKSPLLPDSVVGSAFVGQPLPGDMYRLFLTLEGRGVSVRLKGSVTPDPSTGQVSATFEDDPEQPFETFTVDLEDGPRAPLATPLDCGPKIVAGRLTPWSGTPPVDVQSALTIAGGGCPAPFGPSFGASSARPVAGAFAPFTASFGRPDRNQYLDGVRVKTPPGLAGMVSRVEQCPSAAAQTGACPAASRIGTAHTTAGAGPEPFPLSGPVYLTEGYKGAPFGMAVVVRAIAGPYDLGTVVVRQSIFVDPEDAHLTVMSDPLPRILEGVPVRLRTVDVVLDRKGFVYNPTSCGEKRVDSTLFSTQGAIAERNAAIGFASCERLGFGPRMRMRLFGRRQTRLGKHPGLRVRVTQRRGQANIRSARVTLPLSLALDPDNANAICGYEAGLAANCPARSRIGRAKAISPALNEPLVGPVYLVQGIRFDPTTGNRIRTLPSLLAKLHGEVRVNLRGTTDVARRKLVSTFGAVPDAPVSSFEMRLRGGRGGILAVSARRGLCRGPRVSRALLRGHNGKTTRQRVRMARPCKAKRRRGAQRRRRAKARAQSSSLVLKPSDGSMTAPVSRAASASQ